MLSIKNFILVGLMFMVFFKAFAANDCGLSTINLQNESSIISVQECIKKYLTELDGALRSNEILVDKFEQKTKDVIAEVGLCEKYEQYYKSATPYEKDLYKSNAIDCYALLQGRAATFNSLSDKYSQMNEEAKKIKILIQALEFKYNLLASQLNFLKN